MSLVQGDGVSVEEYEAQFTALSRFAMQVVESEYHKCRKFQDGLQYSVHNKLTALDLRYYNELVNRAKLVEGDNREHWTFQQQKGARSEGSVGRGGPSRPRTQKGTGSGRGSFLRRGDRLGSSVSETGSSVTRPPLGRGTSGGPICFRCGAPGHISRDCPNKVGKTCFRCGSTEHLVRDCPVTAAPSSATVSSGRGRGTSRDTQRGVARSSTSGGPARVFTMTKRDAETIPETVTGMISISNLDAYVLIDSGSTHSFVSTNFAKNLSGNLTKLKNGLLVCTPLSDPVEVNEMYLDCLIKIEDEEVKANLLPLNLDDFDVILGMDWLTEYQASINCFNKEMMIKTPEGKEIIFRGERRVLPISSISVIVARKMLKKGCQCVMAYTIDANKVETSIINIPIVREFSDVFSEELPGEVP